jgi:hypothetical protein
MFEMFYWSSIVEAFNKLPKELAYAGVAYFTVTDIYKRHTQVKIAEVKERTRVAELEVEALKLKRELQINGANIETA